MTTNASPLCGACCARSAHTTTVSMPRSTRSISTGTHNPRHLQRRRSERRPAAGRTRLATPAPRPATGGDLREDRREVRRQEVLGTWAKDVAHIFSRLVLRIENLLDNPDNDGLREWFEAFHEELKISINDSITARAPST